LSKKQFTEIKRGNKRHIKLLTNEHKLLENTRVLKQFGFTEKETIGFIANIIVDECYGN